MIPSLEDISEELFKITTHLHNGAIGLTPVAKEHVAMAGALVLAAAASLELASLAQTRALAEMS